MEAAVLFLQFLPGEAWQEQGERIAAEGTKRILGYGQHRDRYAASLAPLMQIAFEYRYIDSHLLDLEPCSLTHIDRVAGGLDFQNRCRLSRSVESHGVLGRRYLNALTGGGSNQKNRSIWRIQKLNLYLCAVFSIKRVVLIIKRM
jgi:hypothetical protein